MGHRTAAELWAEIRCIERGEPINRFLDRTLGLAADVLGCDAAALVCDGMVDGANVFAGPGHASFVPWIVGGADVRCEDHPSSEVIIVDVDDTGAPDWLADIAAKAKVLGFESLAAHRLVTGTPVVAVLVLVYRDPQRWIEDDVERVRSLGDLIAAALEHHQIVQRGVQQAHHLHRELASNAVIEQAKGMLAATLSISVSAALTVLRSYAHRDQCSLASAAERVVLRLPRTAESVA